jgi:hypothetical protein
MKKQRPEAEKPQKNSGGCMHISTTGRVEKVRMGGEKMI